MSNKDLDTIFLQIDPEEDFESRGSEATWCADQINEDDTEYVRADILHKILDEARVPRTTDLLWTRDSHHGPVSIPETVIYSTEARVRILAARYKNQTEMRNLYEQKAREAQDEKITSMVRQSRRLSEEEEKEGDYLPSADEIAEMERLRFWQSKQGDELPIPIVDTDD